MKKKHGFTLVELLVVIAIIGILAGIIAPKLFGGMDSAKEQQCRNNLRQLHSASINYATDDSSHRLPYAGGFEYWGQGISNAKNGWVSWIPQDKSHLLDWFGNYGGSTQEPSFYDDTGIGDNALWAVEHGTLWDYVKNAKCYVCPVTARYKNFFMDTNAPNAEIRRSYAMNSFFGSPYNRRAWGADECPITQIGVSLKTDVGNPMGWMNSDKTVDRFIHIPQPSRLLLFSEILPQPSGEELKKRKDSHDLSISPHDGCLSVKNISDVSYVAKPVHVRGYGNVSMGFPTTEMICGLHEPLLKYSPNNDPEQGGVYFGSALAVFVDGHIEKVFPLYETSDGVATKKINAAWFLCHGLRPAESVPKN